MEDGIFFPKTGDDQVGVWAGLTPCMETGMSEVLIGDELGSRTLYLEAGT